MHKIKEASSGIFFIALGGGAALISLSDYRLGTAMNMGPGFFPVLIGTVLTLIGAVIVLRAAFAAGEKKGGEPYPLSGLRSTAVIFLSVIVFSLLLHPAGVVASVLALVLLARFAIPGRHWESLLVAVTMAVIAVGIFVLGLGMPLKIWPW